MTKASSINVLVVDDVPLMRKMICDCLRDLGVKDTAQAPDGKTALTMVRERAASTTAKPFDLVFCDWNMSDISGLDVLKEVRQNRLTQTLPLILVTSEIKKENVVAAMQAGVTGYIVKPFSAATIREKLKIAIPDLAFEEPKK
jgi:two-component system chemotaxis response regulator CheY